MSVLTLGGTNTDSNFSTLAQKQEKRRGNKKEKQLPSCFVLAYYLCSAWAVFLGERKISLKKSSHLYLTVV